MQLQLADRSVKNMSVTGATLGLRIDTVSLDSKDVEKLLMLGPTNAYVWLQSLSTRFAPRREHQGE